MTAKRIRARTLIGALLATAAICSAAYSQGAGPLWDTAQLPESRGTVRQYTLTPRGEVDGLILSDGTEVRLPKHLSAQVVYVVRPGDQVSIRGLRARAIPLIDAASITNVSTGKTVVDNGKDPRGPEQTYNGRILTALHGKRGEINGALLEDGTVLRLPPPEAERFEAWLRAGQTISVRGPILDTALGRVIDVQAIGSSQEQMTELGGPRPPRGPVGEPKRGPDRFGPPPPPPPPLPPPPSPRG
jgi:hypothetical protein